MNNLFLAFILALVPILWLIISLGVLKWPGQKACPIGFGLAIILAIVGWKLPVLDTITGGIEGILVALWPIVYIIIAAVFTYNLTVYTGSMETIKKMMTGVSEDKRILTLILAWGFGGFLEAIAGFGTAVAIPAGIMAGLGFNPVTAAVMCLIANTTPTAFGAIGLPVITLASEGGLDVMLTSYTVSVMLFLLILIIPFVLVSIVGGGFRKGIKGVFGITLASGLAFALPQVFVAKYIGAELPAIVGSLVCLGVTILLAKTVYKNKDYEVSEENKVTGKEGFMAWLPFVLVFAFILLASSLFPAISEPLNSVKTSFMVYTGANAQPFTIKWLATPGTLMIVATFLGGILQGFKPKEILGVLGRTIKQMGKTSITIGSIVGMARVMGYSGMTTSIANVLVAVTGRFYPLIAPVIGALGTFVTGSDTSSNILFAKLQVGAADAIGANEYWIAAANMAGATAGKMISPQSIAVATAATGLIGKEGEILSKAMKFCGVYVLIIALEVWFGIGLLPFLGIA